MSKYFKLLHYYSIQNSIQVSMTKKTPYERKYTRTYTIHISCVNKVVFLYAMTFFFVLFYDQLISP